MFRDFFSSFTCTGCADFDVRHRTWWFLVEVPLYIPHYLYQGKVVHAIQIRLISMRNINLAFLRNNKVAMRKTREKESIVRRD